MRPVRRPSPPRPAPFPLRASANGRYLVDTSGTPTLLRCDEAWDAITQLSIAEVRQYLDDRKARGFNAVLVELIESYFSQSPPANANGDIPFTGTIGGTTPDFTTPNPAYWSFVDSFVTEARLRGISVMAAPLYQGSHNGLQGWYQQMLTNGTSGVQSFATFLANRYRSAPNIIWCVGGDLDPNSTPNAMSGTGVTLLQTFADTILSVDPTHLTTTHWDGHLSSDFGVSEMWKLNAIYRDLIVSADTLRAYAVSPTIPCFLIEAIGDGNTGAYSSNKDLRSQYWQVMTSGGCGADYCSDYIWPFGGTRTVSNPLITANNGPWTSHLGDASVVDYQRCLDFFAGIAWHTLVPDSSSLLVTSGRGTLGTQGYVCAAQSADQKLAVIYNLTGATITIAKGQMSLPFTATWFDPSNGATSPVSGSPFSTSGSQSIPTPGNNAAGDTDWAMLLQG